MIARTLTIVFLFGLVQLLNGGCEPPSPTVNASSPPPPPPQMSAELITGAASSVESPPTVEPSATGQSSQPVEQASPRPAPRDEHPIHLSAGVALPQLLPDGTQIGVSVDYKIVGSLRSSRYVLVIESSKGPITVPVQLSPMGGTLQGFLGASVRPEDQPFRARIDEIPTTGNHRPVSNTLQLQTSY